MWAEQADATIAATAIAALSVVRTRGRRNHWTIRFIIMRGSCDPRRMSAVNANAVTRVKSSFSAQEDTSGHCAAMLSALEA
jgi:hypothetical protein